MINLKKKSQKQEKEVAKEFNGRTSIASGALWFDKSDVRSEKFKIECKMTDKDRFAIKASVWEKLEREAIKDGGRIPLLVFDIKFQGNTFRYVAFKEKYFERDFTLELDDRGYGKQKTLTYIYLHCWTSDSKEVKLLNSKGKEFNLYVMPIEVFTDFFKEEI